MTFITPEAKNKKKLSPEKSISSQSTTYSSNAKSVIDSTLRNSISEENPSDFSADQE